MKVLFVTSNPKKIVSPARVLNAYGIEIGHVNPEPEIPEIQAETPEEVAADKALKAFRQVDEPLFCMDSAFFIPALRGFPGTALKQVTEQIGAEGYLRLMADVPGREPLDRSCESVDAIAYMDGGMERPIVFVRRVPGVLTMDIHGPEDAKHKSDLFRIFMPDGETRPLAAMSEDEYERYRTRETVEGFYDEFGNWLKYRR